MASLLTSILNALLGRRPREIDDRPAERELARERERFRAMVANVPGVVWERGFVSDYVTRLLGYTPAEWLATPDFWLTIVHPDDRETAANNATHTVRWLTKDGRTIWCETHSSVIRDEQGRAVGRRGVTMEVTPHEEPAAPEPEVLAEVVPEEPNSTTPDLRRKQILVVHREPEALDFIAGLLRECGARVTPAKSAAEAILALLQHHDLIITEVGVPVAEGVTLAQQLRQANGGLPAIVLRKQVDAGELTAEVVQALTR